MMLWRLIILIAFFCALGGSAGAAENGCAGDKRVIAACYDVHARLRLYANMRLYLWPVDTKRLLAVSYKPDAPEPDPPLPPEVARLINPNTDVFGDFRVCPFTPERPGKQQIVCIDSAKHFMIVKRNEQ